MIHLMTSYFYCEKTFYDTSLQTDYTLCDRISDFCHNVNDEVVIYGHLNVLDWGYTFPNLVRFGGSLHIGHGLKVGETFPHLNQVGLLKTYGNINLGNIKTIGLYLVGDDLKIYPFKNSPLIDYEDLGDDNYALIGDTFVNNVKIAL